MATQLRAPTAYDRSIADDIITRVGNGENTRAIMRTIGINHSTLYRWFAADPELSARYEEARLQGAHAIANEALAILDGDDLDEMVPSEIEGAKGLVPRAVKLAAIGGDPVARARLRFEGRMKLLAKWFPQHYGDKLLHAGHDGGAIKSETALSVKELAQQLRARASGLTIEGDAKELLTDASDRFTAVSVSNERDDPCLTSSTAKQRPRRQSPAPSAPGAALQGTQRSASGALPTGQRTSATVARAGASEPGAPRSEPCAPGSERSGEGRGTVSAGAAGGKRRSRGAGDRGGGSERGASGETGGTPAPQIFENDSNDLPATSYLPTARNNPRRSTTLSRNFSEKNQTTKSGNEPGEPPQSTTPEFPSDEDWAPEDYV